MGPWARARRREALARKFAYVTATARSTATRSIPRPDRPPLPAEAHVERPRRRAEPFAAREHVVVIRVEFRDRHRLGRPFPAQARHRPRRRVAPRPVLHGPMGE